MSTPGRKVEGSKFSKHAQDDSALATAAADEADQGPALTLVGKIMLFLLFPTLIGFVGLYVGFLETSGKNATRELSFDHDFALPFTLGLALCVVIGFQTGGFSSSNPKPLVAWPKVKKRRKVVHKHVVKGQTPEEAEGKTEDAKKTD